MKKPIYKAKSCATRTVSTESDKRVFTAVHEKYFGTYIIERLDRVQDSKIGEVTNNYFYIRL